MPPWLIFTASGLNDAGVAGEVADGGAEFQRLLLADELLDGGRDHRADFDEERPAGLQPWGGLLDERRDHVGAVLAGAEGDIWFVVADVRRELVHLGRRNVRRIAHDEIEPWLGRFG